MSYLKLPHRVDKVFIDLDDTLVDFIGEAANLLGVRAITKQDKNKFWEYISGDVVQNEMWTRINEAGPEWWANLPKLPWADDLWAAANQACEDVIILTSPGKHRGAEKAAMGKISWSLKEFKDNRIILAQKKYMCSSPGAVLIDDWDKFTKPWEERGGTSLLLHRPWHNSGYSPDEIIDAFVKYARFNRRL